jgi:PAS domain S-box-containing protein
MKLGMPRVPARLAEAILDSSPDALLWVSGDDGKIMLANPMAVSLFDLGSARPEGHRLADFAIRPVEIDTLIAERRSHAPLRYLRRSSGGHFPAELTLRWLGSGKDVNCLVNVRDLSGKLASERAVRNADRRSSGIFGAAPYPILLINSRRQIVDANARALELYGYTQAEICGTRIGELLEVPARARDYDPAAIGQLEPTWHRRQDGSRFLAEATLSLVRAERGTYTIVIIRDITDETALHAQLKLSEERWRFALESHGEGLWEWQPDTGELFLSPGFAERMGYRTSEIPKRFDAVEARVHPEDFDRANRAILAHLTGETELIDVTVRLRNRDDHYRWIECRAKTMTRDAAGHAVRLIGTARDVTDQRERDMRERLLQEQIMHTTRLASMGEMATVLAHELNQPLAAISNFAGAALRRIDGKLDDPEVKTALGNVMTLVERAGGIVHRIRDFTRKGLQRVEPVDLNGLITEIARLLEPQSQAVGGQIQLLLDNALPSVRGDRLQLGQLILNLAKNGLEAMSNSTTSRHLQVYTQAHSPNEVEIRISDLGCGLPEQLALDVITPFFTTKANGLGMGLVICRTIVENHGGRFWASPNHPCGTEFHVILPLPPQT